MSESLPFTRWNLVRVIITSVALLLFSLTPGLSHLLRWWLSRRRRRRETRPASTPPDDAVTVAFFHPYCNAGGGGERVLWVAVKAIQEAHPRVKCVIFTGDGDSSGPAILSKALTSFQISLPRPPDFIFLKNRLWVEASTYPRFTLIGQSLGSVFLGWEALTNFRPDVFVDSMGYAFTLPLFATLARCKVASYVHYPTISTDMLARVRDRRAAFNNPGAVADNSALTFGKLLYYRLFALLYGVVGRRGDRVLVNSSWTRRHIESLWRRRAIVVHPPCNTTEFHKLPLEREGATENRRYGSHNRVETILSIGQFRPEKDHALQIAAFAALCRDLPEERRRRVRLVLVGGCRHAEDVKRVENLQSLCDNFQLSDRVDFCLNISFAELKDRLSSATVGLHTMLDEHFGIGVVEMMAAGALVVAHDSGGPKLDIVVDDAEGRPTGFLARDAEGYASAIRRALDLTFDERMALRERARESVAERFSDAKFSGDFLAAVGGLIAGAEGSSSL